MPWNRSSYDYRFLGVLSYVSLCFRCHLGQVVKYDTVSKLGWAVDIRTHSIKRVIEEVLSEDWELATDGDPGLSVPEPRYEEDCVVSAPRFFFSGLSYNLS